MKPTRSRCPLALAVAALLLPLAQGARAADPLAAAYNADGLRSLKADGQELLRGGRPVVESVTFEETETGPKGYRKYKFEKVTEQARKVTFDERARRLRA